MDVGVLALETASGAVDRHAQRMDPEQWPQELIDAVKAVAAELLAMAETCELAYPDGSPA